MKLLLTGATGKVGIVFTEKLLGSAPFSDFTIRALCHNRIVDENDRLEVVSGSISNREKVHAAMDGITHVVHLATCKETPEDVMDVTVKGMFWLLEEARHSETFEQFILVGGDAAIGHFFHPYEKPITEDVPHRAYPGCYALSKVLEEVMLEQYFHQYDLNGCCLRAPWIMEKDDFKYSLSFGEDVFGGPRWRDLVDPEKANQYHAAGTIPVLCDGEGKPITRNFVHVEDLVQAMLFSIDNPAARQELFHICMDEPVDYGKVAKYLKETRGLHSVTIETEYHSTWLDNSKARQKLGWRPEYDLEKLIDAAWDYERSADDPRKVWYPG